MNKKTLVLSLSLLICTFSEAPAAGFSDGFADASADLDWQNLTFSANVTVYAGPINRALAGTASALVIPSGNWVSEGTVSTNTEAEHTTSGEGGTAYAIGQTNSAVTSSVFSESTATLFPDSFGVYSAEAHATRGQVYKVDSAGPVSFSIHYSLDVDISNGDEDVDEYGAAKVAARLFQTSWNGSAWSGWNEIAGTLTSRKIEGDSEITSGELIISNINVSPTSYIMFQAQADTIAWVDSPAPVPVPPSVLMLLTGCTSLFFLKRRKS